LLYIFLKKGHVLRLVFIFQMSLLKKKKKKKKSIHQSINPARQLAVPLATVTTAGAEPAFLIKRELVIGRSVPGQPADMDMSAPPPAGAVQPGYPQATAQHISRRQAIVRLRSDGVLEIHNIGRAHARCNGVILEPGRRCRLLQSNCIES
jgi:hypothetical protein